MTDETFAWLIDQSNDALVEILFHSGRINYDEKDYWLRLFNAIRPASFTAKDRAK